MNFFSQPSILDLLVEKGIACQKFTLCNNFHQQEDRDLTVIKVNMLYYLYYYLHF